VAASCGEDFLANEVEADDGRFLFAIEMATHSIANVGPEFIKIVALCEYRLSKSPSRITAFYRIFNQKNDLVHMLRKIIPDPSAMKFLLIAVIGLSTMGQAGYAQTADKRIDDIQKLYEQTNSDITVAEREAPYSEIYLVELSVNKTGNSYPAVGTYSNVAKFYYTHGDREKDPYPHRLLKINVVTKRAASITNSEFLYNESGQLVFGYVRMDGDAKSETRLYFAKGLLIKLLDGEREVSIRSRNVIDTAAAFKRESTLLVAMFNSALKAGL